jgi:phenylacetate-CoA ligase
VRRGNRYFNFFPGSVGQLAGPDSMARGLMLLGANSFHPGTAATEDKLRHLKRFGPEHLGTVPAYLQRLTAACEEKGWLPREIFPELKSVVLATEAYSIPWAEQMEQIWGCKLHEMYGSTQQGGGIAFTCEAGSVTGGQYGQMHLLEHLSYVEILDPQTGEPVGEGEEGEVILTTFSREASSLVRFATDDKAVYLPGGSCDCGRPFAALLAGNIARYDDMLKIKMVNVWPAAVEAVLFAYPEIAEYQGRVCFNEAGQEQAVITIEFKLDVPAERKQLLKPELETALRDRVGVHMEIVEAAAMLPRFEFKVRRWTDERKIGRQRVFYTTN